VPSSSWPPWPSAGDAGLGMALLIVAGFVIERKHHRRARSDRLWREVSSSGVAFAHVLYATGLWRLRCATLPGAMNWRADRGPGMRRSKRIHRWLESCGAQGNLRGNFPVTRRSCCGSSPETVLRRLKPLPTIVSRPQPSADWCPRHDPDDHPYRLGSTPVNANHSRRTAECKRDPFRQHDLGCGTGRFKSSRPDQGLRGPTECVGDPLGQQDPRCGTRRVKSCRPTT
jgi:hypothetical protein